MVIKTSYLPTHLIRLLGLDGDLRQLLLSLLQGLALELLDVFVVSQGIFCPSPLLPPSLLAGARSADCVFVAWKGG
jgi:hypothetical protein